MKKLILCGLLAVASISTYAQNNKFEIGTGKYHVFNVLEGTHGNFQYLSFTYNRNIWQERLYATVSYTTAPVRRDIYFYDQDNSDPTLINSEHPGNIYGTYNHIHRLKQNILDLGITSNIFNYKSHNLYMSAAPSIIWGQHEDIEIEVGGGEAFIYSLGTTNESFFGAKFGVQYDYSFWKDRISLGANFTSRVYSKDFPAFIQYGIVAGYNF